MDNTGDILYKTILLFHENLFRITVTYIHQMQRHSNILIEINAMK